MKIKLKHTFVMLSCLAMLSLTTSCTFNRGFKAKSTNALHPAQLAVDLQEVYNNYSAIVHKCVIRLGKSGAQIGHPCGAPVLVGFRVRRTAFGEFAHPFGRLDQFPVIVFLGWWRTAATGVSPFAIEGRREVIKHLKMPQLPLSILF